MKLFKNKKIVAWILAVTLTIAFIVGGCAIYVSDYYRADTAAIDAFSVGCNVPETNVANGVIAYGEENAECGFIFYPGGKVEYTAYAPLMRELASKGVLCVLVKMPFNLAVLDMNAADGICEKYPEVGRWYIGGHSLGGAMASCYVQDNLEQFEGLVLLGSYSSNDLSGTCLRVLSVFGSEDKVMNKEKYEECKANLPLDATEIEIQGGCHAYFGMYGAQEGDGIATITVDEQIRKTGGYIIGFMTQGVK